MDAAVCINFENDSKCGFPPFVDSTVGFNLVILRSVTWFKHASLHNKMVNNNGWVYTISFPKWILV